MPLFLLSFTQTLHTLAYRKLWNILLLSGVLNAALWMLLLGGIWGGLLGSDFFSLGWLDALADTLGFALALILALLLFPLTFPLIISLLEEEIITLVEKKYYPHATHNPMQMKDAILSALRFFLVLAGLNLVLLPFYFIPVLNIMLYTLVNGYLLGREFFEIVASHYLPLNEMRRLRKRQRLGLLAAGMSMAAGALVPLANMILPAVMLIFMVHFYHNASKVMSD